MEGQASTFRVMIARPSPLQRLGILLLLAIGFVIGLVIILPLAILLAVLGLLMILWLRIKAWFSGLRGGGGSKGRRNVRVIERSN